MVELNFDRHRPAALLDLTRVAELREWDRTTAGVRLGAGVTYTRVIDELGDRLPGLAMASRTVGSPADPQPRHGRRQPRRRLARRRRAPGPAGRRRRGRARLARRRTPACRSRSSTPGSSATPARPDELITAVWVTPPTGPQQFSKIGTRNAMVISVAAFGLALHPDRSAVGTGIGSAAPTPAPGDATPRRFARRPSWTGSAAATLPRPLAAEFGELVAAAAAPIDDVRGTAAYRLHSLAVMARRRLAGPGTTTGGREDGLNADHDTVNGEHREADDVWEGESLLYVLRERMGLPGSKNACEQGECGSCTVYLDGVPAAPAWSRPARPRAARSSPSRVSRRRRRAAPRPAGVPRGRRRAVRLLHARACSSRPTTCSPATRTPTTPRSARRWPATCAAAPATRRSSTPCACAAEAAMPMSSDGHRRVRSRHDGRRPGGARRRARRPRGQPDHRGRRGTGAPRPAGRDVRRRRGLPATPGLVNTHHHLYQWVTRGLGGRRHPVRLADHALPGVGGHRRGHSCAVGATGALVRWPAPAARRPPTTTTSSRATAATCSPRRSTRPARSACGSTRPAARWTSAQSQGGLPPDHVVEDSTRSCRDRPRRSTATTTRRRTRCCGSGSRPARRSR